MWKKITSVIMICELISNMYISIYLHYNTHYLYILLYIRHKKGLLTSFKSLCVWFQNVKQDSSKFENNNDKSYTILLNNLPCLSHGKLITFYLCMFCCASIMWFLLVTFEDWITTTNHGLFDWKTRPKTRHIDI